MKIGYACKTVAVPGTGQKSLMQKSATPEKLRQVIGDNLQALQKVLAYCEDNAIGLFRISSDTIPFGSSPVNTLAWQQEFGAELADLGDRAKAAGLRLSMHPGQYTVLNSPREDVVQRAVLDLVYHCDFLDAMGLDASHKIILHVGGVYGDKPAAMQRFVQAYQLLPGNIQQRLVIENDDTCYTVADVLSVSEKTGAPVVFDNLHHHLNPPGEALPERQWIQACAATWKAGDGKPKTHYSQQAAAGRPGAHSDTIALQPFLDYCQTSLQDQADVMLEVKDKNRSAVKCVLACNPSLGMARLEREWGRYKYLVLERDHHAYQKIRQLLKDKSAYPAQEMFALVEEALARDIQTGSAVNSAQHVWGYYKEVASAAQARQVLAALEQYGSGQASLSRVKKLLYRLAEEYRQSYLLHSYYFAF